MPNDITEFQQPTLVDPRQQISITLPHGAWQFVLQLMGKGPWDTVDPLLRVMNHQIGTALQGREGMTSKPDAT